MKKNGCVNCGANEMIEKGRYMVCAYCGSKFPQKEKGISINSDIDILLEKCQKEPYNARKYANLILDIDPTNREALKYI